MVGPRQLDEQAIVANVREAFPEIQGIYLFGSYADGTQRPGSDVDLALLFRPSDQRSTRNLPMHPLSARLHGLAGCNFDLVDLRRASTVLQKEVVMLGRRIYCADETAADEFDVGAMSRYQKLNEERAGILEQFRKTGRAYDV
ncbi:MAG: nucleotidyltransferase domain-containing protein [Gammaproteobacteria bacterium]|nr:nucleotidyltransferase domain-containing protein [Gammaproteobacteria bacterium]